MNKFNIALVPSQKGPEIIKYARLFSSIAGDYLLGDSSLPHVTLYQFSAHNADIGHIINKLKAQDIKRSLVLQFKGFSCVSFDQKTYWASLMPNHLVELNELHKCIAEIIDQPVKSNFDPHMTLMSTEHADYESMVENVKRDYEPICDNFILTIGESDEIGQYLKVLCLL